MVTYSLKILNEDEKYTTVLKGTLEEIDIFTFNFENEKAFLKKYNMREKKSRLNNVIISYSYKYDNKVMEFNISDIIYHSNIDFFDRMAFRKTLNIYASPVVPSNLFLIRTIALRYAHSAHPCNTLCKNILSKINTDCSTEYYTLIDIIMKNYKMCREVYFIVNEFESKLKKIDDLSFHQITMSEYNNELTNSGKSK